VHAARDARCTMCRAGLQQVYSRSTACIQQVTLGPRPSVADRGEAAIPAESSSSSGAGCPTQRDQPGPRLPACRAALRPGGEAAGGALCGGGAASLRPGRRAPGNALQERLPPLRRLMGAGAGREAGVDRARSRSARSACARRGARRPARRTRSRAPREPAAASSARARRGPRRRRRRGGGSRVMATGRAGAWGSCAGTACRRPRIGAAGAGACSRGVGHAARGRSRVIGGQPAPRGAAALAAALRAGRTGPEPGPGGSDQKLSRKRVGTHKK
jgi:hypothetical protein